MAAGTQGDLVCAPAAAVDGNDSSPCNGAAPVITDGPFVEAKESIGGFAVIEAADLDQVLAMAKTWPPRGIVEVRPVMEPAQR